MLPETIHQVTDDARARDFLKVPNEMLKRRVYNVTSMSFAPEELTDQISKHISDVKISYKPDS